MLNISTFKYVVEGFVVPVISIFGLLGNTLTILVLNHREVKLKPSLVQILCGLATFDNVFLVFTFFMFTMPALSARYVRHIFWLHLFRVFISGILQFSGLIATTFRSILGKRKAELGIRVTTLAEGKSAKMFK